MLYFIEQGLMPKTGKRYEFEVGRAAGVPLVATIQDFDWADEVLHSQIGRQWYVPQFGSLQGGARVRRQGVVEDAEQLGDGEGAGADRPRELVAGGVLPGVRAPRARTRTRRCWRSPRPTRGSGPICSGWRRNERRLTQVIDDIPCSKLSTRFAAAFIPR